MDLLEPTVRCGEEKNDNLATQQIILVSRELATVRPPAFHSVEKRQRRRHRRGRRRRRLTDDSDRETQLDACATAGNVPFFLVSRSTVTPRGSITGGEASFFVPFLRFGWGYARRDARRVAGGCCWDAACPMW